MSRSPELIMKGCVRFFSYRDESIPVMEIGLFSFRYNHVLYGASSQRLKIPYNNYNFFIPPDHFGFQNETESKIFLGSPKYLLLNDRGREFYPEIYPEFPDKWRYLPNDFQQLKSVNTIQKVYSNTNLEIFMVS